jgi:hypothetical protein
VPGVADYPLLRPAAATSGGHPQVATRRVGADSLRGRARPWRDILGSRSVSDRVAWSCRRGSVRRPARRAARLADPAGSDARPVGGYLAPGRTASSSTSSSRRPACRIRARSPVGPPYVGEEPHSSTARPAARVGCRSRSCSAAAPTCAGTRGRRSAVSVSHPANAPWSTASRWRPSSGRSSTRCVAWGPCSTPYRPSR